MSGYNFTDRLRHVFQMAREEAGRLHHEYVGTEHLLLGLNREGGGVAAAVLTNLGVELAQIQQLVEETVKQGKAAAAVGRELPYTSRAKKVIELAMLEARELNHSYVGTEHLLLGLLREKKGIAAQVLVHSGVTLDRVTAEAGTILNTNEGASKAHDVSGRTGPSTAVQATAGFEATPAGGPPARLVLFIAILALVVAVIALVFVAR